MIYTNIIFMNLHELELWLPVKNHVNYIIFNLSNVKNVKTNKYLKLNKAHYENLELVYSFTQC